MDTLFHKIGGDDAVKALVELFYSKIMVDSRINYFFSGVDMATLKRHQAAFVAFALGGRPDYTGRTMKHAHARLVELGLNDTHFNAVAEHLESSMQELGVSENNAFKVMALIESQREFVLGRETGS